MAQVRLLLRRVRDAGGDRRQRQRQACGMACGTGPDTGLIGRGPCADTEGPLVPRFSVTSVTFGDILDFLGGSAVSQFGFSRGHGVSAATSFRAPRNRLYFFGVPRISG